MSTTAEPSTGAPTGAPHPATSASPADRFMRRLLRLPEGKTSTAAEARSAFQKSLAFTTCRCLLMYIVLPFVLPLVGIARGVGPVIGIVIGLLAMVSIVYSIRRFWRADHSKRWHYTVFGTVIIGFLVYLTIKDIADLAS
ncbi:MAG: hypothetical protein ACE37B_07580 [Ilumatobacter sp.]|jgi:hypothetical protein|uniref:hypothetical protein n=1 Tax=Ilumatobacter sp. TaxID=1967498 RepID=UPI00391BFBF4